LNCRIPRNNRFLNVCCAFGISLKACLLQCLHYLLQRCVCFNSATCCCICALRFSSSQRLRFDAFSWNRRGGGNVGRSTWIAACCALASLTAKAVLLLTSMAKAIVACRHAFLSRHEVRSANPLNLSI